MSAETQLPLEFEHRPALSGGDFLVAPGNREAVEWLDRWPHWPAPAFVLHGPAGCGKTHLAQVFMARTAARILEPDDLGHDFPGGFPGDVLRLEAHVPAFVIEDAERLTGGELEEPFLHLFNMVRESGRHLLLTARRPPARWQVALPDLKSRLNAVPVAAIGPPDDALMAAVVVKLFADRQLRIDEDVVPFLLARMERSFDAARSLVAAIDQAALEKRRNITVPLVRQVLENSPH